MKQFDLKEYLKNPSRKLVTREGCSVRIICTDAKLGSTEIVGLEIDDDGTECIFAWTKEGKLFSNTDTPNDLFFAPETHEGWINVYRHSDGGHAYAGAVYDSKEDAEKRKIIDENYVTTIKIEWEE